MNFQLHLFALISSLILWGYFGSVIMCNITGTKLGLDCSPAKKEECSNICINTPEKCTKDCSRILNNFSHDLCDQSCFGPWFLPILACIPYLVAVLRSKTFKFLRNGNKLISYEDFIAQNKAAAPTIQFKMDYANNLYKNTEPGSPHQQINQETERSTPTKSINVSPLKPESSKRVEMFPVSKWEDVITEPEMPDNAIVKLRVQKSFEFANEFSKTYYLNQRNNLIRTHHKPEEYFQIEEIFDIQNCKEFVMVKKGNAQRPFCMHFSTYLFFSLLSLSWPYRLWVDRCTIEREIKLVKKVEVHEFAF